MAYRPRFGTKARAELYARDRLAAQQAGRGDFPICPHCDLPVTSCQAWEQCHVGAPRANGGKEVHVGHLLCNRRDNNEVVTPACAKSDNVRKRHLGITGPGLGRHPLPAGVRSGISKTIRHGVQPRLTQAEKLAATLARRSFAAAPTDLTTEGVA